MEGVIKLGIELPPLETTEFVGAPFKKLGFGRKFDGFKTTREGWALCEMIELVVLLAISDGIVNELTNEPLFVA